MAVLLALCASLCGGTADFIGGLATRRLPAVVVVGTSQTAALVVAAVLVVVVRPDLGDAGSLVWAGAGGVCMMAGLVAFYSALATGTMGVVAPVSALGVLVPVIWALLYLGEAPSGVQPAGAALGVVGVVLAAGPERSGQVRARSLLLAAASGVGFGSTTVFIAAAAPAGILWVALAIKATIVVLVLPVVIARRRTIAGAGARYVGAVALAIGAIDVAGTVLLTSATTLGLVSLVSVVASLYPIATVLLARWVLAERLLKVQGIGLVATFAGVALLSAG